MFGPNLWRMKRFADSVPELIDLQREINRLFQVSARLLAQIIPQSMSGRKRTVWW